MSANPSFSFSVFIPLSVPKSLLSISVFSVGLSCPSDGSELPGAGYSSKFNPSVGTEFCVCGAGYGTS